MQGYDEGFNACSSEGGGGGGFDQPGEIQPYNPPQYGEIPHYPTQPESPGQDQTRQGGMNWVSLCSDLQVALVSSCDILVNSDNTLTQEGDRAVGCIRNGILLAGGGSFLLHLPLPAIAAALQFLECPTGCDGIVNWGLMGSVGDLRSVINRLT